MDVGKKKKVLNLKRYYGILWVGLGLKYSQWYSLLCIVLSVCLLQICEVGRLVIMHKRTWPNLARGQRGK